MYRIVITFTLFTLGILPSSSFAADPAPILGMTEEQVKKLLGPPDEAYEKRKAPVPNVRAKRDDWEAELAGLLSRLKAPVVKQHYYGWKSFTVANPFAAGGAGPTTKRKVFLCVGFDAKGVARCVEPDGGMLDANMVTAVRNLGASGWRMDPAGKKVCPTVQVNQISFSDEYIVWNDIAEGNISVREKVKGPVKASLRITGFSRQVAMSGDRKAYMVVDIPYDTTGYETEIRNMFVADVEAYWTWILAETLDGYKLRARRERELDPKYVFNEERIGHMPRLSYQEACRKLNFGTPAVYAERLTAGVIDIVRNPAAPLAVIGPTVETLRVRPEQPLTLPLIALLRSGAEPLEVRKRAANVLGQLDDPDVIEPLIAALGGERPLPVAAEALARITEENFGPDLEDWQKWWKDNRKTFRRAYEIRRIERTADLLVTIVGEAKVYHSRDCQTAQKGLSFRTIPLKNARDLKATPCQKCKPPQ